VQKVANFIGGELRPPAEGRCLEDVEPATGETIAEVPASSAADVEEAVSAASAAFPAWSATPAEERSRILLRVADAIEADFDALAALESKDSGKPVALARRLDVPRAVKNFRFFATAILHAETKAHPTDGSALNYTLRQPVGVAGLISPWNLPLYLLTWKIAPAIAAGNT
jgi:aminomuconate-semialdehyde/2-hydroxymuconate-6-semialdehyde dehydrogenase